MPTDPPTNRGAAEAAATSSKAATAASKAAKASSDAATESSRAATSKTKRGERVTAREVGDLIAAVDRLSGRIRTNRIVIVLVALALALVLALGVVGYRETNDQDRKREAARVEQAAKLEAERQERIVTTCLRDNETTTRRREADFAQQKFLVDTSISSNPANATAALAYLAGQRKVIEAKWPYRDCSTAGIKAWYGSPPAPVPCERPDGRGLCIDEPTPVPSTTTTTTPTTIAGRGG